MDTTAPAAKAAQTHFDRWARAYGRSRLLRLQQKRALEELQPKQTDRVLDVACGTGELLATIAPEVERTVGVDLSPGMLEIARERHPQIDFRVGPSDALPFADAEFTAVVCTTALHHFPEPQRSIDEMARVIAPGGRVVIGDMCRDAPVSKLADPLFRRFEAGHVGLQRKRDIEAMLANAGLRVTRSRHVWLWLYGFVRTERP